MNFPLLRGLCLTLALAGAVARAAPGSRPNIILLLPDQMRASAMGVSGNPDVHTELVEEGGRLHGKQTFYTIQDYLASADAREKKAP
jgi:hypothetical protein